MLTKLSPRCLLHFVVLLVLACAMAAQAQTTTVASLTNPSSVNTAVNFTVTVTSASTSTGTVQFFADGQAFGTPQAIGIPGAGGSVTTAQIPFTFTSAGPHTVSAIYTQTAPTAASSSGSVNQVVKATTTTNPFTVAPASPVVFGQLVTFSATVAGGFGIPTGSIQFKLNGNPLGPPVNVDNTGKASYSTNALAVGTYLAATPSFAAAYSGDSFNLASSANLASDFVVNKATPAATLSASPNPSTVSQQVAFSIGVTGINGVTPTGTVQLKDGGTNFGPALTLSNGTASFSTTSLSAATHTITAVYSGDGTYTTATSNGVSQQVDQASTNTIVSSSANPSLLSQTVTFTATVISSSGTTPGGTVQFKDGASNLGAAQTLSGGQASISTASLAQGSHSITAVYSGDTNNITSTSSALTQAVNQAVGSVTLTSLPNPSTFNTNVIFTATVPGNSVATPGGTVTFSLDGVAQAPVSVTASGNNGTASFSVSNLAVGNHSVIASYSGDGNFTAATSGQYTQIVNGGAASATTLASSLNPSTFGQPVTFTATVTATGGTPTGTVTFKDTFNSSTNTIGTGTLDGAGHATFTTSSLAVTPTGTHHVITAVYAGDGTFNGSTSSTLNQTVSPAGVTTVVTSSSIMDTGTGLPTSTFGQEVTFTATVTGTGITPTGTVTFTDGANVIGSGTLSPTGAPREASVTVATSTLTVGTHTITASYGGDANNATSMGTVMQAVNQATPTVNLTSSPNPSTLSQTVTLTATVVAINGVTPTGTVQFQDGTTNIGTPVTLDSNGTAAIDTTTLAVGSHVITAVYSGDTVYNVANATLTQNVTAAASTTVLTSDTNPSAFNQSVTFTAVVTGPGATPTGTVTFQDGTSTLGSATLNGAATAKFTTATLSVGTHSITATYSGDTNFGASASTPPLSQIVAQGPTTVILASSLNPSNFNDNIQFKATVTAPGGGGTPTGSLTFLDGKTPIGNSTLDATGTATFSTPALSVGTHAITAAYAGDGNFANQTSTALSQVVKPSSSSVSISASVNPSVYRQPVTYTVTVIGKVTPSGTVAFYDGDPNSGGVLISDPQNPPKLSPSGNNGQSAASFTFAGLSVGKHGIFAVYSGDSSNGSNSQSLTQAVNQTGPTVTVSSDKPQPAAGDKITFTATITGPAGGAVPTGAVQFQDGGTNIGASQPVTNGVATLAFTGLSVGTHTIAAVYSGDGNYNTARGTISQTVFDTPTAISAITPNHLLVPGTIRPSLGTVLKTSDSQTLTITGHGFAAGATVLVRNQTPGATLPIDGQRLTPDAPPTTDANGVSTLTVTIPPVLAAVAGLLTIEVDNPNPQPDTAPGMSANFPINPVQTVQNFALGSTAFIRMFSLPYDYTGVSPYDVLAGVTLNGDLTKGYDPDINNLTVVSLFPNATLLPLYHWDPTLVDYRATVPLNGRSADNVQFILGQAYWVVGKTPPAATLGVMRLGVPAAFNPSGIPLQPGWNMVGDPFPTDAPLANLGVLFQGASIPFYGSNSGVSNGIVSPVFWSYDGTQYQINYGGLAGHDQMLAYEGYWLYCYQPCTLLVTK